MVRHMPLEVENVSYDANNPRITPYLEGWDDIDHELIGSALQHGDEGFRRLTQAILTTGTIINPIIVELRDGRYTAIEGNTRLCIYKKFHEESPQDERWQAIPATVYEDMSDRQRDAIRLQAHLVGVTNWSPYAKAKYLHYLSTSEHLPLNDMVEFCGGKKSEVIKNINAYKMMENEYRPAVERKGRTFEREKFSIFLEMQNPGRMQSIIQEGFAERDFIDWVVAGKFEPRQEFVRALPKIMNNPRALEEFKKSGAKQAIKFIDRPALKKELLTARLSDLCDAIQTKTMEMSRREVQEMRSDPESRTLVEDAISHLENFYKNELEDR